MPIKDVLRRLLRRNGYDVVSFSPISHPLARRQRLLESYKIDVVLDVGADTGQWASQMRREIGYSGRIVSFEPLRPAFESLKKTSFGDPQWRAMNYALGDVETVAVLNVAGNSHSSSFLGMMPAHIRAAPQSKYVGTEIVEIKTLDSIFDDVCSREDNIYLKIDTQGYESRVIKGAENSLAYISTIQMEMSLVPLYHDQLLFNEMYCLMSERGYNLIAIETGFSDKDTGQMLQVDGIFHRC